MTPKQSQICGDAKREAVDALKGYVYQLYQSAAAWIELANAEILVLEVAEDYAILTENALDAVQVKDVLASSTINTAGVVRAIDSLLDLRKRNPQFDVSVRYLSTGPIGLEKRKEDQVGGGPALEAWKRLAKSGDTAEIRAVLLGSKLKEGSKEYIVSLDENQFREQLLRKVHFDCAAPPADMLRRLVRNRLLDLVAPEGGTHSQMEVLETAILHHLLLVCAGKGDRKLDRSDLKKIVDQVVLIPVSRADMARQNELVHSLISAAIPAGLPLQTLAPPLRPLPALPVVHIPRNALISLACGVLERYGIVWYHGASGMGKTLLARMTAARLGGDWFGATLRGLDAIQSSSLLGSIGDALSALKPRGVILDDLDEGTDQSISDAFQYVLQMADRLGIPIIVTSTYPASSKLRFALDVENDLYRKVPDFTEEEIGELVRLSGGKEQRWSRYVYVASGSGHPQLSQALIQNIAHRGWPIEELETLASILGGNAAIEEVRSECRRRLLRELPAGALLFLQRISLHIGRFTRQLALDVSALEPAITNAGFLLDELVGPWVDQLDTEQLQLSPLLSGLAKQSLTEQQQRSVHYSIADFLTRGRTLNASEMNAAVFSALISQNESAATKFCLAVFQASNEDLSAIAVHLDILGHLSPKSPPWPENTHLNQMFRGVQLLLLLRSPVKSAQFSAVLEQFRSECGLVEDRTACSLMELMIYTKLLITWPVESTTPEFLTMIARLFVILRDDEAIIPAEMKGIELPHPMQGVPLVVFAFMTQLNGIRKIDDLPAVFDFVAASDEELRTMLLQSLDNTGFDADMFVRSAWLAEDSAGSINPLQHAGVLEQLENISSKWRRAEVAISCRKHRAIILDEYGGHREEALGVLDEGLTIYGNTNPELMRAKAKVLYRADNHSESLSICRGLIETSAITSSTDRAFLGRQAAISAEHVGEYTSAREYYLYASAAARESGLKNMIPMATGLLADAALAAWRNGERGICLKELASVLREVEGLDPETSLRAAHVRAASQHILLWLDQEATGRMHYLDDGRQVEVYPGCVSNPEPHVDIGKHKLSPVAFSFYMLARIECDCDADSGLADTLDEYLPDGPLLEGEGILVPSLLGRALRNLDAGGFHEAWEWTLDELAYYRGDAAARPFNLSDVTYGTFPKASPAQFPEFESSGQVNVLLFCGLCIIKESPEDMASILDLVSTSKIPPLDQRFFACLAHGQVGSGFNNAFATLIHNENKRIRSKGVGDPAIICLFAFNMASIMAHSGLHRYVSKPVLDWYKTSWKRILAGQLFQLISPGIQAPRVQSRLDLISKDHFTEYIDLILSTMPMTNLAGQNMAKNNLQRFQQEVSSSHDA